MRKRPRWRKWNKPEFFHSEFTEMFRNDPHCSDIKKDLSREFLSLFVIILASGVEHWLLRNLDKIGDIPAVFRTIGQSNEGSEALLKHLQDRVKLFDTLHMKLSYLDLPKHMK